MASDIPTEKADRDKLVQKVQLRYLRSCQEYADYFDKFRRMERWWGQVESAAQEGDEYAIRLGIAFSIVEGMHAKITEPLFQMGLPCDTYPRHMRDWRAVENFKHVQQAFYQGPNFQEGVSASKKSMCIVGHRWEFDGFSNIERRGKMWGMVPKEIEVMRDGKPFKAVVPVIDEVEVKRKVSYGFMTEFPRWDEVHPEPGRTTIDTGQKTDMTWIIRDLGYLTVEDLAREVYYNKATGKTEPLYDLSEMMHFYGKSAEARYARILAGESGTVDRFGAIIVPERGWDYQGGRTRGRGDDRLAESQALEDRDKIWVVQCREMNEILTIAQGRFVIHRKVDPWHVPGLKVRIENYTTDGTGRLYGKGAIEPVEGELGELDDMHGLGMQNIFRLVNRMTYIREDALVNEDDLDPRAGGHVRIKTDQGSVQDVVRESQATSPINEMLAIESELRGIIEKVTGDLDGSPGVMGTKQDHKTAKGLGIIVNNLTPHYARLQRQARINEVRRCMNMADILEQFHFDKVSYRVVKANGSTAFMMFDRSDIDTEGRGFDFAFNMDPLWGNPAQRLALKRQVYTDGVEYMKLGSSVLGPDAPHVDVAELFRDVLRESGYVDTSAIFKAADGSMSPDDEMQVLAQGGVVKRCGGDLVHHAQMHLLQSQSPALKKMMEAGKADPRTAVSLQLLAQQCVAELRDFVANPMQSAAKRLDRAGAAPSAPEASA